MDDRSDPITTVDHPYRAMVLMVQGAAHEKLTVAMMMNLRRKALTGSWFNLRDAFHGQGTVPPLGTF